MTSFLNYWQQLKACCKTNQQKGFVFCILIFSILFVGCNDNHLTSNNNNKHSSTGHLKIDGKELFSQHCKLCHGIDGTLQLNGAKDLNLSILSLEERIVNISNGKNAMTPFKQLLSKNEIEEVAKYTLTFSSKE